MVKFYYILPSSTILSPSPCAPYLPKFESSYSLLGFLFWLEFVQTFFFFWVCVYIITITIILEILIILNVQRILFPASWHLIINSWAMDAGLLHRCFISLSINQLRVSVLTVTFYKQNIFWWRMRDDLISENGRVRH